MLILYAILFACIAGGAAFIYHGIGASAVAKHEHAVQVETDKIMAVAKAKTEATANALVDMQAAFEAGQAQHEVVTKTVYVKGQDYVRTLPPNKDCIIPDAGMEMLNKARAAEAVRIFGWTDDGAVKIEASPPKPTPVLPKPAFAPPVPSPVPPSAGARPKPVPLQ